MEEEEKEAYLHAGSNGAQYAMSIGKSDLKQLTGEEWLTFCECICKSFRSPYAQDEQKNVPF